jgi:hypothetical protein
MSFFLTVLDGDEKRIGHAGHTLSRPILEAPSGVPVAGKPAT